MRIKVSIALPEELLRVVDQRAKQQGTTRSNLIERALHAFITRRPRDERSARDREVIDRNAHFLNQEAADVLEYQRP